MPLRPSHLCGRAAMTCAALMAITVGAATAATPSSPHPAAMRLPAPAPALAMQAARTAAGVSTPSALRGSSGLMAFLDPETGQLAGPVSQVGRPEDVFAPVVLLEQVPVPGGGWMMDLKGTGLEYYVLQVDALGRREVSCVQDPRQLAPRPPAPAGPRAEER